jgi:hypothetical protein
VVNLISVSTVVIKLWDNVDLKENTGFFLLPPTFQKHQGQVKITRI